MYSDVYDDELVKEKNLKIIPVETLLRDATEGFVHRILRVGQDGREII